MPDGEVLFNLFNLLLNKTPSFLFNSHTNFKNYLS
jgi:hypothetical protein